VETLGTDFDPVMHEAMLQMPSEKYPEGKIAQIFEKGFKFREKIIRHAKVGVSKGKI
jgi:molecular chaperone GrpE